MLISFALSIAKIGAEYFASGVIMIFLFLKSFTLFIFESFFTKSISGDS